MSNLAEKCILFKSRLWSQGFQLWWEILVRRFYVQRRSGPSYFCSRSWRGSWCSLGRCQRHRRWFGLCTDPLWAWLHQGRSELQSRHLRLSVPKSCCLLTDPRRRICALEIRRRRLIGCRGKSTDSWLPHEHRWHERQGLFGLSSRGWSWDPES